MNIRLKIFLIVSILIYLSIIIYLLRKKDLNLKYTLIWFFSAFVMLVMTLFPTIIKNIASVIGIIDEVNVVFVFEGMFVLLILLMLTSIVSRISKKNRILAQKIALQDKQIRDLTDKLENKTVEKNSNE